MAKKTETAAVSVPEPPKVPITIGSTTYSMTFDMDALADAEEYFLQKGETLNLLRSLTNLRLNSVRTVFACAVHHYQPDLSFQDAKKLLSTRASVEVANYVVEIWNAPQVA